jgi:hypothetical protein
MHTQNKLTLATWLIGVCTLVCPSIDYPAFAQEASTATAAAAVNDDNDEIRRLAKLWEKSRSAFVDGQIEYLEFHSGYEFPELSRDAVLSFFHAVNFADEDNDSAIRNFACAVMGRSVPDNPPPYPRQRFSFSASKSRDVNGKTSRIDTGSIKVVEEPIGSAKQITIGSAPGQLEAAFHSLASFIWIPEPKGAEQIYRIAERTPTETTLTAQANNETGLAERRLVVDSRTGDVLSMQVLNKDGKIADELVQSCWTDIDDMHRIPKVILNTRYDPVQLQLLTIRLVSSASFDVGLTDSTFVVSGTQGDVLLDNSVGRGTPEILTADIDNVEKVARSQETAAVSKSLETSRSRLFLVIALNTVVIIVILACLWNFRNKHKK